MSEGCCNGCANPCAICGRPRAVADDFCEEHRRKWDETPPGTSLAVWAIAEHEAAKAAASKEAEMSQEDVEALEFNEKTLRKDLDPVPWSEYTETAKELCLAKAKFARELFGAESTKLREELQTEKDRAAKLHAGYAAAGAEIVQLREDLAHEKARCEAAENRARQEREQYDEEHKERLRLATEVGLREKEITRLKAELKQARDEVEGYETAVEAGELVHAQQPTEERDPDEPWKLVYRIYGNRCGLGHVSYPEGAELQAAPRSNAAALVELIRDEARKVIAEQSKPQPEAPVKVGEMVVLLSDGDGPGGTRIVDAVDSERIHGDGWSRRLGSIDKTWRLPTRTEAAVWRGVLP